MPERMRCGSAHVRDPVQCGHKFIINCMAVGDELEQGIKDEPAASTQRNPISGTRRVVGCVQLELSEVPALQASTCI